MQASRRMEREFKASLDYIGNSRQAWAAEQDFIEEWGQCKMSVWDGTDPEDMGTHRFPLFILSSSPTMEGACWIDGDLLPSLSDAVPSLAGFIYQEEEEVIPQMALRLQAMGRAGLGSRGCESERRNRPRH